ncbi:hypothetical protein EVAR_12815_1 [Eumeta japonica]|uniref:Uncharacterized protein n=1 Tax=Eumeta variegata TaxID=151549 RepID=A0A4C1UC71_EUMVA|nr:hypothetical protein EVAR_12815_1 [Eumeta japonica]
MTPKRPTSSLFPPTRAARRYEAEQTVKSDRLSGTFSPRRVQKARRGGAGPNAHPKQFGASADAGRPLRGPRSRSAPHRSDWSCNRGGICQPGPSLLGPRPHTYPQVGVGFMNVDRLLSPSPISYTVRRHRTAFAQLHHYIRFVSVKISLKLGYAKFFDASPGLKDFRRRSLHDNNCKRVEATRAPRRADGKNFNNRGLARRQTT